MSKVSVKESILLCQNPCFASISFHFQLNLLSEPGFGESKYVSKIWAICLVFISTFI